MIWTGEIDEKFLTKLIDEILTAKRKNTKPRLVLTTEGGDAMVAAAACDWLDLVPTRITVSGYCMSAGVPILACGDERLALPNTQFMYHPTTAGVEESRLNARKYLDYLDVVDRQLLNFLVTKTVKSAAFWRRFNRDTRFFGVDEALDWGLIDTVISEMT